MSEIKRLNYYDHQYLREPDFTAEQKYHKEMRYRHNRSLHTYGIVDGLAVSIKNSTTITVSPGMALDGSGRELILDAPQDINIGLASGKGLYITIKFTEEQSDPPPDEFKIKDTDRTRWTEKVLIGTSKATPADPSLNLILGRVISEGGTIKVDDGELPHQRRMSGATGQGYFKKIGIGTETPDKLLTVRGNGDSGNYDSNTPLNHKGWQGEFGKTEKGRVLLGSFADQPAIQGHGSDTSYRLLINPYGGNVGIGTINPKAKLDIDADSGDDRVQLIIRQSSSNQSKGHGIGFVHGNGSDWIGKIGHLGLNNDWGFDIWTDEQYPLRMWTHGKERMQITGDGSVGIGTTTPKAKLDIDADSGDDRVQLIIRQSSSNQSKGHGIGFVHGNGSDWIGKIGHLGLNNDWGFDIWTDEQYPLRMWTHGKERMQITGDGSVGIGTTTPKAKLDIDADSGDDRVQLIIRQSSSNQSKGHGIGFVHGNGSDWIGKIGHLGLNNDWGFDIWTDEPYPLRMWTHGKERMQITGDGKVGIGTSNPYRGKLEIVGSGQVLKNLSYAYLNGKRTGTSSGQNISYSLYADGRIATGAEFNAFSDLRIKNIIGRSDDEQDLNTLLNIKITDFCYIDTITKGCEIKKKVIGQQVKNVYPEAVSTSTDIVPDIFQPAKIHKGWIRLSTNLSQGERVQLLIDDKIEIHDVIKVSEEGFQVDSKHKGDVFVYGREVEDFHLVDYDAISMLNVSATQHLHQLIQNQQFQINDLKSKLEEVYS